MQWKVRKKFFMVSWQMNSSDDEKRCHHLPSRGRKKSASCSHLFTLREREKKSCSYSNWILIVQSAITQLTSENSTKEDLTQYVWMCRTTCLPQWTLTRTTNCTFTIRWTLNDLLLFYQYIAPWFMYFTDTVIVHRRNGNHIFFMISTKTCL